MSFKNITTFNLDEYVGLSLNNENSYHYYMQDKFFSHIDIQENNTHLLNGSLEDLYKECIDYENLILKL